MKENNLMTFYVIGKAVHDRKYKFATLSQTSAGWSQESKDRALCFQYVCKEKTVDLLEWFRCDYSQYRIFDDVESAQAYLSGKEDTATLQ